MREYLKGIFQEKDLPGVFLGVVEGEGRSLLIDAPLRVEEARQWLASVLQEASEPAYLVLLDENLDRALGARHFDLPRIAHKATSTTMHGWPDTYKGSLRPIGAEANGLKRVTGIQRSTPDMIFESEMAIDLPGREVRLIHQPGPTPGSIWVEIPDKAVVYIGDAVTVMEPPFLGDADIDAWLESLEQLRQAPFAEYKMLSSRDGLVDRDDINNMARFLRKIPVRIERLGERVDVEAAAEGIALELIDDFRTPKTRLEPSLTRLRAGLLKMHSRQHPDSG